MTISERVASNARLLCKYQGKDIGEMEKAVGVSTGYLSRVKGRVMLRIDTSYALAEYLGTNINDLVSNSAIRRVRIEELKAELAELEKEEESDADDS